MKFIKVPLLVLLLPYLLFGNEVQTARLTEEEAFDVVSAREAAKEARKVGLMEELGSAVILNSRTIESSHGTLIVNSVQPIALPESANNQDDLSDSGAGESALDEAIQAYAIRTYEQISMSANVYDDAYSEIIWRETDSGELFTVWTNINLNYLRPVTSISEGDYEYMYFGFISSYTEEEEDQRILFALDKGYSGVESRWKAAPVEFSSDEWEYVVVLADPDREVPEQLYRQLNAILGYYVANREELEIAYHNSVMLEAARLKHLEEHPPAPRQTLINFWKIEEEASAN